MLRRWRRVAVTILVLLAAGAIAQGYVSREFVVASPGLVRDAASMVIVGTASVPDRQGFHVTTIYAAVPSPGLALRALLEREVALVRRQWFTLPGETLDDYEERARLLMVESHGLAVVAALVYLGHPAALAGEGALVAHVLPRGPLAGRVERGDTITALDGRPTRLAADLAAAAVAIRPGVEVTLRVEDPAGEVREVRVRPAVAGTPEAALGVSVVTRSLRVEAPLRVQIEAGEIGGPSAGLAFALEIIDRLDPADLTGGRRVAATGTVDVAGRVGLVGGVTFKVWAAEREGVELLLVPLANRDEARAAATRLRVIEVASLNEAVSVLRGLGPR